MRVESIRRLVKIVEESDIAELEVSRWGRRVKISKYPTDSGLKTQNSTAHFMVPAPQAQPVPEMAQPLPSTPAAAVEEPAQKAAGIEIKSPMVGTFYRAPAPDAEPYVKTGDTVQKGSVLCIIEAMKLMNEIEAEFPCRILEILVENEQPVEYNQPLFLVEKV